MNFKRRGAETGSSFQEAINRTNEAYERAGRAFITRKAIPGKYLIERGEARQGLSLPNVDSLSGTGQARMSSAELSRLVKEHKVTDWRKFIPESKAEPDYGGVVAPNGRAIFYDAKTTRRDLLDFDNLHAHQIGFLESTARFGAIAGFLVEFSKHGEVYFLPIQVVIRWREESTRKSLPHRFFSDHLTAALPGKGFVIHDYLTAVETQEQRYGGDFAGFDQVSFDAYAARMTRKVAAR
jgi:penicillin-binding protein-related factor A (putative recombinase)